MSSNALADDSEQVEQISNEISSSTQRIDDYVDQLANENEQLKQKIEKLKQKLDDEDSNSDEIQKQIDQLTALLKQQEKFIAMMKKDFNEYKTNAKKYIYKARGKKVMPYLYAVAAFAASSGSYSNIIITTFAGFGFGSFVESNDIGLTAFSAFVLDKVGVFNN